MNYGNLLGRIRAVGMTQAEVARKVGISATTFNRKLCGHVEFTQSDIMHLCRVLEIPDNEISDYFFTKKL